MTDSRALTLDDLQIRREDCIRLVHSTWEHTNSQKWLVEAKARLGLVDDSAERAVIRCAAEDALPRVEALPVHPAVKSLLTKELNRYLLPSPTGEPLLVGSYLFAVAVKLASLRRFPAGPMDWTISGIPRSWLIKIPVGDMPRTFRFLLTELGGIKPAIYTHVAPPPRKRALVIAGEVRRAYYRMACSLKLQPKLLGIMTGSWVHDPETLRQMPQLAVINEPYTDHGGFVTTAGPAPADSGFLEHSPERKQLYEEGKFRPLVGLAMWPRKAAIAWADKHPELN